MRSQIVLLFCSIVLFSCKRADVDGKLINDLIVINCNDQKIRNINSLRFDSDYKYRDSINKKYNLKGIKTKIDLSFLQDRYDSTNKEKITNILHQYGYPGKSLVGSPFNSYVWYVMMHQNKNDLEHYLLIIKEAVDKGELENKYYCQMLDRVLMHQKKEQVYGTQGYGVNVINDKDEEEMTMFIWPIKDFRNVNKLRKKAGFNETVEQYCKNLLGIDFKGYTLNMVNELEKRSIINHHHHDTHTK
jgi:hypothetical protein